jgi:hypothetical protein
MVKESKTDIDIIFEKGGQQRWMWKYTQHFLAYCDGAEDMRKHPRFYEWCRNDSRLSFTKWLRSQEPAVDVITETPSAPSFLKKTNTKQRDIRTFLTKK